MLVILSPAKTLDYETPPQIKDFTEPQLLDNSKKLIKRLRELSPPEISELMGISDKLGNLNFGRYLEWKPKFTPQNAKQAVLAFKGDVYTGLNADTLDKPGLKWAQKHVRILSGLYGILRPLDLMQPYRLEMGTKLQTRWGDNLYQFWGDTITDQLNAALKKEKPPVLVNLASNEYFKSVNADKVKGEIITPVFKDWKSGKYKIISFFAKKARGMMTRYIIDNRLDDVEGLKDFDVAGYRYNPAMSEPKAWVFIRKET